jgi:hypothetical protein
LGLSQRCCCQRINLARTHAVAQPLPSRQSQETCRLGKLNDPRESRFNTPMIGWTVLVAIALYVAGYFGLCESVVQFQGGKFRVYKSNLLVNVYYPLARFESGLTGQKVEAVLLDRVANT